MLIDEMAAAQAAGICLLARLPGLPEVHALRAAVVQLHPESGCAWCPYPLRELAAMCGTVTGTGVSLGVGRGDEKAWWAMPGRARIAAIRVAQEAET